MKKLLNSVVSIVAFMVMAPFIWSTSTALAAQSADPSERKNIALVGFNDLQSRSTYQPVVHQQGVRYILYAGHHSLGTNPVTGLPLPSFNPLTGMNEPNGTSLIDVSDPRNPVFLAHIPVGTPVKPPATPTAGGAQMVRVCDGSTLPIHNNKVYMLRTYTGSTPNTSAHEIWDTTDPEQSKADSYRRGGQPCHRKPNRYPQELEGVRHGDRLPRREPRHGSSGGMETRQPYS